MGYFYPKNTFLQLKRIQMIYLTLISTACMKIHQIPYVIFETVSYFSRHNSSVFFCSNITCFLQKKPIKVHNFRLSTAQVKIHQIPHIIFQTKSPFFFKVWITFQWHEREFFCTFLAETSTLLKKISHQSANFQTCQCSH